MDILIFSKTFYPIVGGMESSARIMARELAGLGVSVTVVTGSELAGAAELQEGFEVVRTDSFRKLWHLAGKAHCLVIRGGESALAGLPALVWRRPIVCFHEMAGPLRTSGDTLRQAVGGAIRKRVLKAAHLHVGVSRAVLTFKQLPEASQKRCLYNPVVQNLWTAAPPPLEKRNVDVLFVGRILESKGVFVLADALQRIPSDRGRVRVGIVGEGGALPCLQVRLATNPRLETYFWSWQRDEALRNIYGRARMLIVPSIQQEGMGMVAAEALANGTPVVAANQAPLLEVVGNAGLTYPPEDRRGLAVNIDVCLADCDLWQRLHNAALIERQRFSIRRYRETLKSWIAQGIFS